MLGLKLELGGIEERFSLDRSPILLGRHPRADIHIQTKTVHRKHAVLVADLTGWTLIDLASTHGTFVNGERIVRHEIGLGDQIKLGAALLTVVEAETAGEPVAPGPEEEASSSGSEEEIADLLAGTDERSEDGKVCQLSFHDEKKVILLASTRGEATIGSAERATIRLLRPDVSSLHALVRQVHGVWQLLDLKSDQGVTHEDRRVETLWLADGTSVRLGSVRMDVSLRPAEEDEEPTRPSTQVPDDFAESTPAAEKDPTRGERGVTSPEPVQDLRVVELLRQATEASRNEDHLAARDWYERLCEIEPFDLRFRRMLRTAQQRHRRNGGGSVGGIGWLELAYRRLRARRAYLKGDVLNALRHAERGLAIDPWNKALLLLEGAVFEARQRLDLCIWTLETALEKRPLDPQLNRPLARILHYQGELDRALLAWSRVEKVEPHNRAVDRQIREILVEKTLKEGRLASFEPSSDSFDESAE